jgi:hypothetical protein
LRLVLPAAHFDFVRRRVVLHLLARLEMILSRGHDGRLPDALLAAESRQRGIRQRRAAGRQLFMDSHQVPLAGAQELEDLLAVWFGFLGALVID